MLDDVAGHVVAHVKSRGRDGMTCVTEASGINTLTYLSDPTSQGRTQQQSINEPNFTESQDGKMWNSACSSLIINITVMMSGEMQYVATATRRRPTPIPMPCSLNAKLQV